MSGQLRLVLALHNHQPIGNFAGVFEAAFQDSYAPFLEILRDYPDIPISLHTSGSLLEWLVDAHPEYIDQVRMLVERGQVEILGGPFYEPILACIPRRDRIGQIRAYTNYLEKLFGQNIRGMWVPERVWEQQFAGDITEAGIEYTLLDDYHFRGAGLEEDELHGFYLSEDEGRLLKIFPGSERLRYTIPFQDPHATIDYLRHVAHLHPGGAVVFGDDGEKFGTWPGTKSHVYDDGWLRRFFDTLRENSDWLKVATLAEVVDNVPPSGSIYLPDASYREMTEWALPTDRQILLSHLTHAKESEHDWHQLKQFLRGGFWRNFRVKYPESNEMYSRMLQISNRLEEYAKSPEAEEQRDLLTEARTALYRAQCNCSYWHGAFGGLYLPHLRNAVYTHLIAADNALEKFAGRSGSWVAVEADDYDLNARKEIRMSGSKLVAYLAPTCGGHLYELDVRSIRHNLLATLNRRPEPYHEKVRQAGGQQHEQSEVASIHDMVAFKQPDLDKKIQYDTWPRKSLVDHFFQPGLTWEQAQNGVGEMGDFVTGVYETLLRRSPEEVQARMWRTGRMGQYEVKVTKTVSLVAAHGGQLEVLYELENLPADLPIHFGVEFNFAGMAAGAPDRFYYDAHGAQLGQLESIQDLTNCSRIGLVDEWLGMDVALETSEPGHVWAFPIQTISQSESGFELVHQSAAVIPHWEILNPPDGCWSVKISMNVDTSAAQARQLSEPALTS